MKLLSQFPIYDGQHLSFSSKVCNLACSLYYEDFLSPVGTRIDELVQSYFNQWHQVMTSYGKLSDEFVKLNSFNDRSTQSNIISQYDIASIDKEDFFKDYSYLLLVSMKTLLDLFAAIVEIVESKEVRPEDRMVDIFRYSQTHNNPNQSTRAYFVELNNKTKFPWIDHLKESRNKLIHRGYRLQPVFGFEKGNDLIVELVKGLANDPNRQALNIGTIFKNFVEQMPIIDDEVSQLLRAKLSPDIHKEIIVSFRSLDLIKEYSYKEIDTDL